MTVRRPFTFASAAVLALIAACATAHAMSLEEELARLAREHPNIQAAEKAVQSAEYGIDSAEAALYPNVNVTADAAPQRIDSPSTRAAGSDFSRTRNSASVTVTQNLYNGEQTLSNIKTARLSKEQAQIALDRTRQQTLFEGARAYIDVLRQKRLTNVGVENVNNIEQQLNLEDERVQRGSGVTVDVLEAKSRLQIAKERLVNFEGALKDAISRYSQVFSHAPDIEGMTDPAPPIELVPTTLDEAIQIAIRNNPTINDSVATIELARERRRTVKSQLFPLVDLEGSANYEKHNDGVIGTRRDYQLVLRATWNLFSGFSTPAEMSRAAFDYRASKDNYTFVTRKVAEQVRLAWQALLTTRNRVDLLENAVNIAAEVFDSRRKLREAGKETVINVLDAENQVNSAQINYISAAYDERLAVYQLLLAMGRLTPANLGLKQP